MSLTTYAELQASIADWLIRSDLTAVIPDFISLTEAEIQRDLTHWRMYKRDTLSVSSRYTTLPTDFLEPIRFEIDGQEKPLEVTGINELQARRHSNADTASLPLLVALTAGEFEVWPTPGETYTMSLVYRYDFPALSDSNTSNWLLAEAPDVYLYGALSQAAPYLVDDPRLPVWQSKYGNAMNGLQMSSDRARFGGNMKLRSK